MRTHAQAALRIAAMAQTIVSVCLIASLPAGGQATPQTGKLDILNASDSTVNREGPLTITVVARDQPITLVKAMFKITDDVNGNDLNEAFPSSIAGSSPIEAEHTRDISFSLNQQKLSQITSAKGSLTLWYKAGSSPKLLPSAAWGFKLIHAVPSLTVASHPNDLIRYFPFTSLIITSKNQDACQQIYFSPGSLEIPSLPNSSGDPYPAATGASRPQGMNIDASFTHNQVCFNTKIPGQYTELKAKFHIDNPSIKSPVDFDADLFIKDHWVWRALAAVLATFPAFALIVWTNTIRRRILNRNQREEVMSRLAQFLAANPAFANDSSVTFIRQLIVDSTVEDNTGQFDASQQSLQSASSRIEQLFTSATTGPTPLNLSGQAIRILNPASCILTGRKISFVIGQPDSNWPANGGKYLWILTKPDGTEVEKRDGVELKRFDHTFNEGGPFAITVSVGGANPQSRQFTVLTAPPASVIERLKIVQASMLLITFLLATGTAYVSTQNAATFGTFADYFGLIAKAFGISGTAGSVATILSAVKMGS
jgi:hypothetical protein